MSCTQVRRLGNSETSSGMRLGAAAARWGPTVSGGDLILQWPADHTGWTLQVQTNSLNVGLNTNWSSVAGSALVNSVTNAINPENGAVFYRMVYP